MASPRTSSTCSARSRGSAWRPRGSAFFFKGKQVDLREVGQKLQVSSVLEGSVRKAGKRLRVTAELVNAEDGYQLWSERYDRELEDIFDIQDEIARSVVEKLKVKLLGEQQAPVVKRPTDNLEAYNLFLKGRYHLLRITGPSLEKSLECFTQALAVEPTYAQAHALTGMVQGMRAVLIFSAPQQVMPMAKEAALKALALDESVGDGHFALAASLDFYEWKWTEAEREYRRALELNPGDTLARSFYADLLGRLGRADASVAEARHAVEREPLSVFGRHILAIKLYHARRFDDAIIQAFGNIELDPTYYVFHQGLGWALAGLGRHEEAVAALGRALSLTPDDLLTQASVCLESGLAGQRHEAVTISENLDRRRANEYVAGVLMAIACLGLGDREQAMAWLYRAADERDPLLPYLNVWVRLIPPRRPPLPSPPPPHELSQKLRHRLARMPLPDARTLSARCAPLAGGHRILPLDEVRFVIGLHNSERGRHDTPPAPSLARCGSPVPHAGWLHHGLVTGGRDRVERRGRLHDAGGADRQLGLPNHDPHAARPRGVGPRWQVLPRAHARLFERVEFRRQLFEDGLSRPRPAHGVPRRGPVDHHVTRTRDCGRAVRDRATVLADLLRKRTNAA